jgi:rubrerythrin
MGVKIVFETDNAAFADGNSEAEVARILRKIADRIEHEGGDLALPVWDINGNTIGSFGYVAFEPEEGETVTCSECGHEWQQDDDDNCPECGGDPE